MLFYKIFPIDSQEKPLRDKKLRRTHRSFLDFSIRKRFTAQFIMSKKYLRNKGFFKQSNRCLRSGVINYLKYLFESEK